MKNSSDYAIDYAMYINLHL